MDNNSGSQVSVPSLPGLLMDLSDTEQRSLSASRDRGRDLESAVRIFLEFLRGFEFFGNIDRHCVTVFGSARFALGHRYYEMARRLGSQLALAGYGVMTGGGPGIMEAANRGAREAGGSAWAATSTCPRSSTPIHI
jgi:SLOG cluster4 family